MKTEQLEGVLLLPSGPVPARVMDLSPAGMTVAVPHGVQLPAQPRLGFIHSRTQKGHIRVLCLVEDFAADGDNQVAGLRYQGVHTDASEGCLREFLMYTLNLPELDPLGFQPGRGGLFYWFDARDRHDVTPEVKAQRREERNPMSRRVSFVFGGMRCDGMMLNASRGGMLIATDEVRLPEGKFVEPIVGVPFTLSPESLRLHGLVKWVGPSLGDPNGCVFGVRLNPNRPQMDLWRTYVDEIATTRRLFA